LVMGARQRRWVLGRIAPSLPRTAARFAANAPRLRPRPLHERTARLDANESPVACERDDFVGCAWASVASRLHGFTASRSGFPRECDRTRSARRLQRTTSSCTSRRVLRRVESDQRAWREEKTSKEVVEGSEGETVDSAHWRQKPHRKFKFKIRISSSHFNSNNVSTRKAPLSVYGGDTNNRGRGRPRRFLTVRSRTERVSVWLVVAGETTSTSRRRSRSIQTKRK
jgi:hypothetical protein